ncbi:MAG: hypothetical protein ACLQUZ_03540 [Rhizomicrobium sp.]
MKKLSLFVLMCALAVVPAAAQNAAPSATVAPAVTASKGQMLHDADGGRLAPVYRVTDDGSVQIIFYGKVVTVPHATLSMADGELKTSLTKDQVLNLH